MTIPHTDATANLTIDGLAICCFNKATQLWEVGYLHPHHPEHHHDFILDIEGGPRRDLSDAAEVWIDTLAGLPPAGYPRGFYDHGPVNRRDDPSHLPDEAKENFHWAIDLEDPASAGHGAGRLKNPGYPVTRAFISNAVFYTKRLPLNKVYKLPIDLDATKWTKEQLEQPQYRFGWTNDEIGADITCAAIVITIIYRDRVPEILLPLVRRPGRPWKISLKNMRPVPTLYHSGSDAEHESGGDRERRDMDARTTDDQVKKGDFHLYYDAFQLEDERLKFALWGYPNPEEIRSGRTDCNTVFDGTSDNLNALFA